MIRKLLIPLLLFTFSFAHAETIKTDVLVIGGGGSGVAAAIQAARSKVKTLLVEPGPWLGGSMTIGGMCVLDANRNLPSGIWGEFRQRVTDYYRPRLGYDTTHNSILRFEPYTAAEILKKMTDTVKNLTVKLNTPWTAIKKDGTGWEVTIAINGEIVKVDAKIVIDGTETGEVAAKAGAQFEEATENITWIAILKDFGRNANKTIPKPEGYDPALYNWLKKVNIKQLLSYATIPNDKYMIDWDIYEANDAYTGLKIGEVYKKTKQRTLGLVYYLQTELGYKNLGLDGQFNTPDSLPFAPYVLESKHVKGAVKMVMNDALKPYERESKVYRTSIAVSDALISPDSPTVSQMLANYAPGPLWTGIRTSQMGYTIPLGAIVVNNLDNMLVTEKAISISNEINSSIRYPAVQMTLGQGVGATAAYCAFFKTTTKHLNVRVIQGEILDYKGYLLPFTDIPQKSHYFRAVQQICATGLLRGIQKPNGNDIEIHFGPDDIVKTEEIQPTLTEIYTRGFLWFNKEKPGAQFTLGNLLSLISDYTLTDPKTLQLYVQKFWATQFRLTGSFDLNRPVTRLEFAVLANRYLNPFAKTVDLSGRIVN